MASMRSRKAVITATQEICLVAICRASSVAESAVGSRSVKGWQASELRCEDAGLIMAIGLAHAKATKPGFAAIQ